MGKIGLKILILGLGAASSLATALLVMSEVDEIVEMRLNDKYFNGKDKGSK